MTYDIKCPVCGKLFQIDTASPGRPRHFCSKTCANIEKFYSFAMDKLEKVPMTAEAKTYWKGRLFRERQKRKPIGKDGYFEIGIWCCGSDRNTTPEFAVNHFYFIDTN